MADKSLSENTLRLVAERFRVLADPVRLSILDQLRRGEMSVGALVEAVGSTQANVSKHLQLLYGAGLVKRHKEGLQVIYDVGDPTIFDLCEIVCGSLDAQFERELKAIRGD